ncbi:gamma-glutamylcyclotransferase [Paralimibaculum aggregatum]|uniref:glutathione-specific gamma-glutamylcyclotransferase n=2 Tax=Paralimibaculum aggregatum TaxID=3036245 RepID=A0ABQ6LGA9_9RHOB|nr:gamma-glutamylcyclotransferase [Limibaculum sp. NKW23]
MTPAGRAPGAADADASPEATPETAPEPGFWVFAYGSLMWNPGFQCLEHHRAWLHGYARAFALSSIRYRGTPEAPGLVLGLDWRPGAVCAGVAFRVCRSEEAAVRDYLHHREMVTRSYIELVREVTLDDGRRVPAQAYVLDRTHRQYAGALSLERQAEIIARAVGPAGPNDAYLHNTVDHLREIGIEDPELFALDAMVRARSTG